MNICSSCSAPTGWFYMSASGKCIKCNGNERLDSFRNVTPVKSCGSYWYSQASRSECCHCHGSHLVSRCPLKANEHSDEVSAEVASWKEWGQAKEEQEDVIACRRPREGHQPKTKAQKW